MDMKWVSPSWPISKTRVMLGWLGAEAMAASRRNRSIYELSRVR